MVVIFIFVFPDLSMEYFSITMSVTTPIFMIYFREVMGKENFHTI